MLFAPRLQATFKLVVEGECSEEQQERIQVLRTIPAFNSLPHSYLATMAHFSYTLTFNPGQTICRQVDPSHPALPLTPPSAAPSAAPPAPNAQGSDANRSHRSMRLPEAHRPTTTTRRRPHQSSS